MIRMLAALGVFVFTSLWFLGADHGQLLNPTRASTSAVNAKPQQRAVFIPVMPVAQPVVQPLVQPAADPVPELVEQAVAVSLQVETPAPLASKVMHAPGGATVRSGPGRKFPVVGSLSAGGVVMVADDTSVRGWIKIRTTGVGEGWIAAKLLRQ